MLTACVQACACHGALATRSRSGQFVVHSENPTVPTLRQPAQVDSALVWLEPDPLIVSCERIKQGLLRQLGLTDRWEGQIHLWLSPRVVANAAPPVVSTRYPEAWRYDVNLPQQADPTALLRTLVYTLLTEYANRFPGSHAAELPIWFIEGLTGQLMAVGGPDLVFQPNALVQKAGEGWAQLQATTRNQRLADARIATRRYLGAHPALSFNELSLPIPELLNGTNLEHYRVCARLFVGELQRMPGGEQRLQSMLGQLTSTLNWQTAFLRAFEPTFPQLLEVEKWWAVTLAAFLERDEFHAWPLELSLKRLEEVLRVEIEVRSGPGDPPQRDRLTLTEMINRWALAQQAPVLQTKLNQLTALQTDVAQPVVPIVVGYRAALSAYLEQRVRKPPAPAPRGRPATELSVVTRDTLRRLEDLDRQRASLATAPPQPPTARR